MNDADLEMMELTRQGNREARLFKLGICCHGWYKAPPGQPAVCNKCGQKFDNEADLLADRRENLI